MSVTVSARGAGISRRCAYQIADGDPEFKAAWDSAIEEATDLLEDAIRRRAIEDETEPVWYRGEIVGHVQKTSDILTMFLMKARRPAYRDAPRGGSWGLSGARFSTLSGACFGAC
jgi:hypothetical protein